MNSFATILKLDFNATFRSRWFWVYAVLPVFSNDLVVNLI